MITLVITLIVLFSGLLTLYAYVDRLYTEMGKFFLLSVEDNIESFEKKVEPRLKLDRGRGGLTFALLTQMMIVAVAILSSYLAFSGSSMTAGAIVQAIVLLAAGVILFAHLIPHILIRRTSGNWLASFGWVLRWSALLALVADLVLSVVLWIEHGTDVFATGNWIVTFDHPWMPELGIGFSFALDGISLLMVVLTALLGVVSVLISWDEVHERVGFFHFNLLWILGGVTGVFLAMDLFLFYFFWEVML